MFPPKRILFPVDFSERCLSAARMVEIFTGRFEAELTLLHVLEPLTYNDIPVDSDGIAEQRLGSFMAEELKHFNVQRVLLDGDPADQIVDYAQSNGIDLIMLPTHGYSSFRRLILGSVTAKILHRAECPVWTGVHMEHVPRLEDISFRRVLCAVDLDAQSCPTASWAKKFAGEFGAQLELVHAVPQQAYALAAPEAGGAEAEETNQATGRLQAIQACTGIEGPAFVLTGDISSAVCDCAAREKADLVVIGRSAKGGVLGRLRANAYSIIRQSPCPVLSV